MTQGLVQPDDSPPHTGQPVGGMTNSKMTPADSLLKRYEKEIDLYKFYLDISVKASLFAFGITGALLSYFFANHEKDKFLVWSLTLPIILNAGFFVLFFASIGASTTMMYDHMKTCEQLNGLEPFDTNPLPSLCKILSCMYALVTLGLVIVLLIYAV